MEKKKAKETKEQKEDNKKDSKVEAIVEEIETTSEPIVEAADAEKAVEVLNKDEVLKKEEVAEKEALKKTFDKDKWTPKTSLGKKVKDGDITSLDYILDNGLKILEAEIVDILMPDQQQDLLMIGQSKGKFGGGQRRVFRQTQKKTMEGNKPHFATYAVVGNMDGYVGLGYGKAKETVPAREKAIRKAKLNVIKVLRGCGSWECNCGNPHTVPFEVMGKCGSVVVKLKPAPKGTGLCIEKECAKILKLAGYKDIWSRTEGITTTKINHIKALMNAMDSLMKTRITLKQKKEMNIIEGSSKTKNPDEEFLNEIAKKEEQE